MINFYVKGQELTSKQPIIIPYSVDYLEAEFHFMTSIWNGLTKWAIFIQGEKQYPFVLDENNRITQDKHLNLSEGEWKVFLQGNDVEGNKRITAAGGSVLVTPTGFNFSLPEIGLSATEQITNIAKNAEIIAKEANEKAVNSLPFAERAEKAAAASEESAQAADQSETAAKSSEAEAAASQFLSAQSAEEARQALSDLLRMLGTDIATLVDGKIPADQIPSIATTEIYTAASAEEQQQIKAETGDILIRKDENKSYIYSNKGWTFLVSPTDFASRAAYAETAKTAENAMMINGHRFVEFDGGIDQFKPAVKDPKTYYLVHDKEAEVQP